MDNQDFIKKYKIDEDETQNLKAEKKRTDMKHGLMMALCCALPFLVIMMLPVIGFGNISWSWVIFLLCPLMHIGMMFKKK